MNEEVIAEKHSLTYKELKEILDTMSDKDLEEEVFVEYKAYCKDGKDWYDEWTDAVSYELIHTKSDHEFYNNRKYLRLYLKSYSDKTNEG
jgi:hypothetical protein